MMRALSFDLMLRHQGIAVKGHRYEGPDHSTCHRLGARRCHFNRYCWNARATSFWKAGWRSSSTAGPESDYVVCGGRAVRDWCWPCDFEQWQPFRSNCNVDNEHCQLTIVDDRGPPAAGLGPAVVHRATGSMLTTVPPVRPTLSNGAPT